MKRHTFVLSLLIAISMVVGAAVIGHAGDLKVSGFADILYIITNDQPTVDLAAGNTQEQQFVAKVEVDFEKQTDDVTFRLDLDFPSGETPGPTGMLLATTNMSVTGLAGGPNTFAEHIEQANFNWAIPNAPANLSLTGGIFNSPIGYESQDAPDRSFITFGQLFAMVPSNLTGIEVAGSEGPFSASIIYVDEWRTPVTAEENSFGGTLGFAAMPEANLSVGYLTSEQNFTIQDEDVLDIILSGSVMPGQDLTINYALEFLTDENNDGYAITVSVVHAPHAFPHALSIRYDSVDCDATTAFGGCGAVAGAAGAAVTPTSFTISGSIDLASALTARLEYSTYDSDGQTTTPGGASLDADMVLLQFVATFM